MKKNIVFRTFIISIMMILIVTGCSSDQKKIAKIRKEENIEILSEKQLLDMVKEGKSTVDNIFETINFEKEIEFEGITYNPLGEKYNSPKKMREALNKYYSNEYTDKILETIPARYIENVYVMPLGDMGLIQDKDEIEINSKKDLDENTTEIKIKESEEIYRIIFKYSKGFWRIDAELQDIIEEKEN